MANMPDDGNRLISPALLLIHEMIHAMHYIDNSDDYIKRGNKTNLRYDDDEEKETIILEKKIAAEIGEYQRETHHGRYVYVDSITLR